MSDEQEEKNTLESIISYHEEYGFFGDRPKEDRKIIHYYTKMIQAAMESDKRLGFLDGRVPFMNMWEYGEMLDQLAHILMYHFHRVIPDGFPTASKFYCEFPPPIETHDQHNQRENPRNTCCRT